MQENELTYWMAFAESGTFPNESSISAKKRNELIADFFIKKGKTVGDFMEDETMWDALGADGNRILDDASKQSLRNAKTRLANYAIKLDEMTREGYVIVPITDIRFPEKLKKYCKYQTPTILYAKGNMDLLRQNMTAIVGCRKASQISLDFTQRVARRAVENGKVVVSGFAKGVDQMASASAINAGGSTVVVLPQGIRKSGSVFKQLYCALNEGRVLCLSLCPPNMPWSVGLAMERNAYIYGLADEIYAAESDSHGGTWEGVRKGLRDGATVYVRRPEPGEKCANGELIRQGAIAVDGNGEKGEDVPNAPRHLSPDQIAEEAAGLFSEHLRVLRPESIKQHLNCSNDEKEIAKVLDARPDLFDKGKEKGTYIRREASLF